MPTCIGVREQIAYLEQLSRFLFLDSSQWRSPLSAARKIVITAIFLPWLPRFLLQGSRPDLLVIETESPRDMQVSIRNHAWNKSS